VKIRWLSFVRAASRLCQVYESVFTTLKELSKNDATAKGLRQLMAKMHIILWIHALADIYPTLNFVLNNLEKENIDVNTLEICTRTAIENLTTTFLGSTITSSNYNQIKDTIAAYFDSKKPLYGSMDIILPKTIPNLTDNIILFEEDLRDFVRNMISNIESLLENLNFVKYFQVLDFHHISR
jgi:hypothetical protein